MSSITLSRKWTARRTTCFSLGQSIVPSRTMSPRLIDPRLQDSYGKSGCSPQGFVDSIRPALRGRIVPVEPVEEENPGFPVLPRLPDNPVENVSGGEHSRDLPVPGIDQGVAFVVLHGPHEGFRDSHGEIEIVQLALVRFALDESEDIRVVHPQDSHVRAPPGAALLDRLRGQVEHLHERDGPAGNPRGGHDHVVRGPDPGKGKSRPAAGLVNERGVLYRVEDLFHGIPDGQHEAGRELSELPSRVHEGRGIGEEFQARHDFVELIRQRRAFPVAVEFLVRPGDRRRNPPEHVGRGFQDPAVLIPAEVTFFQDGNRVLGKAGVQFGGAITSHFRAGHSFAQPDYE